MQIISNIALISINETFIVQLISFLIFLFIINRIMFRPLRNVMSERENHIDRVKNEIAANRQEVEDITRQIDSRKAEVRAEARNAAKQLEMSGVKQADEIVADAQKEIDLIKEDARRDIQQQIDRARRTLEETSETLCLLIMEKALERRVAK